MKCLHPIGLKSRVDKNGYPIPEMLVPCGKCAMCLEKKRNDWFVRLRNELDYYLGNGYFITLTYNDLCVPQFGVSKRDLQLWFKRFRKYLKGADIRYFFISEYGPNTERPHYHGIIFNFPHDKYNIYTVLEKTWPFGIFTVDKVNDQRINYCASYMCDNDFVPKGMLKNFMLSSRRPAIGLRYLDDNNVLDYYRESLNTFMSIDGKKYSMPRYYRDKIFDDAMKAEIKDRQDISIREREVKDFNTMVEITNLYGSEMFRNSELMDKDAYQSNFNNKRKHIRKKNNGQL